MCYIVVLFHRVFYRVIDVLLTLLSYSSFSVFFLRDILRVISSHHLPCNFNMSFLVLFDQELDKAIFFIIPCYFISYFLESFYVLFERVISRHISRFILACLFSCHFSCCFYCVISLCYFSVLFSVRVICTCYFPCYVESHFKLLFFVL